jgi:hypothetical protein
MYPKYNLEADLDTLPIADLKKLSLLAIKSQTKSRVKAQRYYEKHGEKCRDRAIQNYTLKKSLREDEQSPESLSDDEIFIITEYILQDVSSIQHFVRLNT